MSTSSSTSPYGNNSTFPTIPDQGGWIAPYYSDVLRCIQANESPFTFMLGVSRRLYYPRLGSSFRVQLCILGALFACTIAMMTVAVALRSSTHRGFYFFLRLDRTVVLPATLLFPLCTIAHAAMGIAVVVGAHQIARAVSYPRWYTGLKLAWIAPLWTGIIFEVWACLAAWYMRRFGPHYRESWARSAIAFGLPFVVIVAAWTPAVWFFLVAATSFNASLHWAGLIEAQYRKWESEWTPDKGLEIDKSAQLFEPGGKLADNLVRYGERSSGGSRYVVVVLGITLIVYVIGATLELNHLSRKVRRLQQESKSFEMATAPHPGSVDDFPLDEPPRVPNSAAGSLEEKMTRLQAHSLCNSALQVKLTEWTRTNRILTTACISLMLIANASLQLWKGLTPLTLQSPSTQFQADILISGWVNSLLSIIVSFLILLRSLDGSAPLVVRLKEICRFLPLPPSLNPSNPGTPSSVGKASSARRAFGAGFDVPTID
ncbi:uncharacterized protein JCM15063_006020 [Sporobolomyces koalae]|uniref:uncharacterized protein n=1 Tax=Sporobolomyces koalae TaxID=500713 RepID=UPI00316DE6D3